MTWTCDRCGTRYPDSDGGRGDGCLACTELVYAPVDGGTDRSDALVVTYRAQGRGRRLRFEPRSDDRYDLLEETLTKTGTWREVGHEIVETVSVEGATEGAAVLSNGG